MTALEPRRRDDGRHMVEARVVEDLADRGYWLCGRCGSVLPVTFWHRCDDSNAHSAPYERRP